jgi:hypothetical protein
MFIIQGHSKKILTVAYKTSRPFRIMTGSEDNAVAFHAGPPFKTQNVERVGDTALKQRSVVCVCSCLFFCVLMGLETSSVLAIKDETPSVVGVVSSLHTLLPSVVRLIAISLPGTHTLPELRAVLPGRLPSRVGGCRSANYFV